MYRILICDDCAADAERLKNIIIKNKECPSDTEISVCHSGEEVLSLHIEKFDVLILDIQLNDSNGNEIGRIVRERSKDIIIVFISAVESPNVDSFLAQPFRYIMKYFDPLKISAIVSEILQEMKLRQKKVYLDVASDGKVFRIEADDIVYVMIKGRHTEIAVSDRGWKKLFSDRDLKEPHTLPCKAVLKEIYEKLKDYNFVYAHHSYIINLQYVIKIQGNHILLETGVEFNLARSKRDEFHKRLAQYVGCKYRRERCFYLKRHFNSFSA